MQPGHSWKGPGSLRVPRPRERAYWDGVSDTQDQARHQHMPCGPSQRSGALPCLVSPFYVQSPVSLQILHRRENTPRLSLETWLVTCSIILHPTYFLENDKMPLLRLGASSCELFTCLYVRICVFQTHLIVMSGLILIMNMSFYMLFNYHEVSRTLKFCCIF